MNHVTDDRTDRPLDRDLHDWLERSIEELPDQAELPPAIRSDVLSRLPGTPQRRRWWPFRWFPFGIGATRSAEPEGPHPEGRTRSMFSATRVAVVVAALALTASLAYVAVPENDGLPSPASEAPVIDPETLGGFTGTMRCTREGPPGDTTHFDWGTLTEGQTWASCTVDTSDPRFSGNDYSVHDYYRYEQPGDLPTWEPTWGVRSTSSVVTNEGGTWVAEQGRGWQNPEHSAMRFTYLYRGTGEYEGLTALTMLTQNSFGLRMDVEGVIFPGDLPPAPEPPIEAASAMWEQLAAD